MKYVVIFFCVITVILISLQASIYIDSLTPEQGEEFILLGIFYLSIPTIACTLIPFSILVVNRSLFSSQWNFVLISMCILILILEFLAIMFG